MKADRMSMANSLELRTPILDYRLVEWAARAAPEVKVGPGAEGYVTKRVLRRFASSLLPASIIERPKRGFPVPVYGWLSGSLAGWARDLLTGSAARLRERFDVAELRATVERGSAPGANGADQHRLWNLLVLELWMREWMPA